MMFALLSALVLASLAASPVRSECEKIDSCSCRDSATGRVLSLHPLANTEDKPAFSLQGTGPEERYTFLYNPCLSFTETGSAGCRNAAVCQKDTGQTPPYTYLLGIQATANFSETSEKNVLLSYTSGTSQSRNTKMELICDESAEQAKLEFVNEYPVRVYNMKLTTKCACPGGCSGPPPGQPTCTPEGPKNCACRLSTDDKLVNLLSLDNPNAPLVVSTATSKIYLNLCSGMNLRGACTDSVACVQQAGQNVEYGHPSTGNYSVDASTGQVTLTYKSQDNKRETRVHLVCDEGQRHYPRLIDVGEPTESFLELELRSVCACPGECLSPPTVCTRVDDCTCELSEDLGTINLHNLDNPFAPLRHFVENPAEPSTGQWYYYNPCTNFSVPGVNNLCRDIAACQVGQPNPIDFPLGVQNTVTYRTSSTDEDVVTLLYTEGYHDRQVAVTLHCNQSATTPTLTFDKEDPEHYYFLSLYSKDACPKAAELKEVTPLNNIGRRNIRPSRPILRN